MVLLLLLLRTMVLLWFYVATGCWGLFLLSSLSKNLASEGASLRAGPSVTETKTLLIIKWRMGDANTKNWAEQQQGPGWFSSSKHSPWQWNFPCTTFYCGAIFNHRPGVARFSNVQWRGWQHFASYTSVTIWQMAIWWRRVPLCLVPYLVGGRGQGSVSGLGYPYQT